MPSEQNQAGYPNLARDGDFLESIGIITDGCNDESIFYMNAFIVELQSSFIACEREKIAFGMTNLSTMAKV